MSDGIDKNEVLVALRTRMQANLQVLTSSQAAAQSGAIHEETRQEDPKDTRAIEATYLARGLADRVETLRIDVVLLGALRLARFNAGDAIGLTALVGLRTEDDEERIYFLVPTGGGEKLVLRGVTVQALTPGSPLGNALVGKRTDEDVEVALPNGVLRACVVWVR